MTDDEKAMAILALCEISPAVRLVVEHAAEGRVVNLADVFEAAGHPVGKRPGTWSHTAKSRGRVSKERFDLRGGCGVWADAETALLYAIEIDEAVQEWESARAAAAIVAHPGAYLLADPQPWRAIIAMADLEAAGFDHAQARRRILNEVKSLTVGDDETHRETLVAQVQRALDAATGEGGWIDSAAWA